MGALPHLRRKTPQKTSIPTKDKINEICPIREHQEGIWNGGIMCEYCKKVRDDNEPLIWDEDRNGELQNFVEIRYKHGQFELWSGICFRKINYCPMCGRKLTEE